VLNLLLMHALVAINKQFRDVSLREDVLADLLEANIASYNKQWSQSADAFLKAAKQSKDPRLASYAAALAMEVGDAELALEAATLWASSSEQRDKVLPASRI